MLHRLDKRKWARANFVELNHLWWEKGGGAGIGNGNTKQDSGLEQVGAQADYSPSTRHHQSFLEPALLAGALTTLPSPSPLPLPLPLSLPLPLPLPSTEESYARRQPRPAPPISLNLSRHICHGRLYDAFQATITLFSSTSQSSSSWSCVAKVVDTSTFERGSGSMYDVASAKESMRNEWEVFEVLTSLQGKVIPRVYGAWIAELEEGEDVDVDVDGGVRVGKGGMERERERHQVMIICMQDAGEMWTDRPDCLDQNEK